MWKSTQEHFHTHNGKKIQVIWSHVTLGSRTYSILSVFIFLSLIKAQPITLNNWKTMKIMKNNEKPMKKIWTIQQQRWNIRKKIHAMEGFQIYNWSHVTPGSRKYSIFSVFVFLSLIKAQRITLNNWKALKNNETWWKWEKNNEQLWKDRKKQWKIMKNKTKTMNHDEKERKNNETWWKI